MGLLKRERVGVRELRQNLSKYLRKVAKGKALEVTERGKAVAVLGPIPETLSPLQRLIAEGRATAPTGRLEDLGPPLKMRTKIPVSQALEELREDTV